MAALQATFKYKSQVPDAARRKLEGLKVRRKVAGKIPLVIGKVNRSILPELEKSKFLFPANAKVVDLCQYINSKLFRPDEAPLYIYVDNWAIVSKESTMAELYQEHREDDYFLYLSYSEENAFSNGGTSP